MASFTFLLVVALVFITIAHASVISKQYSDTRSLVLKERPSIFHNLGILSRKKGKKCRKGACDETADDADEDEEDADEDSDDDDDEVTDDDSDDDEEDSDDDDDDDDDEITDDSDDDDDSDDETDEEMDSDDEGDDDDSDDEDELSETDEPEESEEAVVALPAECPTGYLLRGKKCILSSSSSATTSAAVVPPTDCPRGYTFSDGVCTKGRRTKSPKCPKSTKSTKNNMCLSCDPPARLFKKRSCKLPKTTKPSCPDDYELEKVDGDWVCAPDDR